VKVRILSAAIEEISEAALWFDEKSRGLGGEFWRLVDHALSEIERNLRRFAKSEFATPHLDLRFVQVARFKYVIHFAMDVDEVLVVAVTHAARRPGYWVGRVKS
jgi:hypothetical protein